MTTDFVVTRHKEGRVYFEAYQVKRSPADLTPRTSLNIESTRGKTLGEVGIPTSIALRFKT